MEELQPESTSPAVETPAETAPQPSKRPAWVSFLIEMLQTLLLALVLYVLIDSVIARVRVENISMQPTLQAGEFLLVNKLSYRNNNSYQYGDIIVFHYPPHPQEDYIKRIIGRPGDTVVVREGRVEINGAALNEPYIAAPPNYSGSWTVPEGELFVLGDNRNQSSDSHSWGFVPTGNVVGKALVIYWPLNKLRVLSQPGVVNAAQ